jgi:hypothetical protein
MRLDYKPSKGYNHATYSGKNKKKNKTRNKLRMIPPEFLGQPVLTEQKPAEQRSELLSIDEVFDMLEPYTVVSAARIQALKEQFAGTPMEGAFLDIPEGQDISAEALAEQFFQYGEQQPGMAVSQESMIYGDAWVEEEMSEAAWLAWQSRAAEVQQVAATLVPGKQVTPIHRYTVIFDQNITDSRYIVLHELREQQLQEDLEEGYGREVIITSKQVRVFAQQDGTWTEQAGMAFMTVDEVEDDDDEVKDDEPVNGLLEEERSSVVLLPGLFPANFFDKDADAPTTILTPDVVNEVCAAVPPGLALPQIDPARLFRRDRRTEEEEDEDTEDEHDEDDDFDGDDEEDADQGDGFA